MSGTEADATSTAAAAAGLPGGVEPTLEQPVDGGVSGEAPDPRMFSPGTQTAPPGMEVTTGATAASGDETPRTAHLNTTAAVPTSPAPASPLGTQTASPTIGAASSGEGTRRVLFARPKPVFTRDISTPPGPVSSTQALMDQIAALQVQLNLVTQQMELMKTATVKEHDMPTMHIKDVDKPSKYSGGDKWSLWESEFTTFLARRDRRWKAILLTIKIHSDKPINHDQLKKIRNDENAKGYLAKDDVYEAFVEHLYEYLKTYTAGDINSMILANGVDKSFESWRRLCDQGRSRRVRPMRDERRALYHPRQATTDGLVKAIADWEKKLAEYISVKPEDAMGDKRNDHVS